MVIKIFGDDLDLLDRKAKEVAQVVAGIRGAADVQVESPPGAPRIVVRLRPERLKQFGFRPVDVMEAVGAAYEGSPVAQTYEAGRVFDVAVILDERVRQDPEAVGGLMLANQDGLRVPLRQLADVFEDTGRTEILHDGTRRRQAVTCDVRGRDLTSFVEEVQRALRSKVAFPAGSYAAVGGASAARAQARRDILVHSLAAAAGILLLLSIVFRNTRNLLLVLANLPFALVGGVLAVFATGGLMTVGAMVGFVTLFGITMRNSMMMISHFEHLVERGGHDVGIGSRAARRVGAPGPDPHDSHRYRARPASPGDRQRRSRPRDRRSDGRCDPGRAGDVDRPEPAGAAHSRLAPRTVRARPGGINPIGAFSTASRPAGSGPDRRRYRYNEFFHSTALHIQKEHSWLQSVLAFSRAAATCRD